MVGEPIEQRRGHLGVAEDARPFAEGEVRSDDDRRPLVEPTDEVEEELSARLREGQIAELVEDDEVQAREVVREPPLTPAARLDLEPVDEIDDVVEASTSAAANAVAGDRDGKMALAGSSPTDQYRIALLVDEAAGGEIADECLVDRCALELEV